MNRCYRLVWNEAKRSWVVASELARRQRTWASGTVLLLASGAALADPPAATQLPSGGQVVAGAASIATSGLRMDVHQSTPRAAIDWQTFDVGRDAHLNFEQPSAASVTLNRVLDSEPSKIFGRVTANGQVYLANPNGVYFAPSASVDVGGLVATTHGITDEDFMAGRDRFTRDGATGAVVNEGELKAALGGYVALLAPEVRNQGAIVAHIGTVALAAGESYELQFERDHTLASLRVAPATVAALVENGHAVHAPGGMILLSAQGANQLQGSVVRSTGVLEATALAERNGRIFLESGSGTDGQIFASGSIDASSAHGDGGAIEVEAGSAYFENGSMSAASTSGRGGRIAVATANGLDAVASYVFDASGATGGDVSLDAGATGNLTSSAAIVAAGTHHAGGDVELTGQTVMLLNAPVDATGRTSGGSIHVGGEWQGSGELRHADQVLVGSGSVLDASGTSGAGGEVVVWSDRVSRFAGSAVAAGGAGGNIEISSLGTLHYAGTADAGAGGNVLFDPKNITIAAVSSNPTLTWMQAFTAPGGTCATDYCLYGPMAIDGDRLAVGQWANNAGVVYLYTGATGTLTYRQALTSGTGAVSMPTFSQNYFGIGVALDGDLLAVGAALDESVYLLNGVGSDFSGLTWRKTLTTNSGAANMGGGVASGYMGWAVALDSGRLAVGVPFADSNQGALHLFDGVGSDYSGLTYRWTLADGTRPAGMTSISSEIRNFSSIVMDGDRLIAGGMGYNAYGRVNYFSGLSTATSASQLVHRLEQTFSGVGQSMFGMATAMSGDYVYVGAPNEGAVYGYSGANALFAGTSSSLTQFVKVTSASGATNMPTVQSGGEFGSSLALSGNTLYVGEQRKDLTYINQGQVHQFTITPPTATDTVASATFATSPGADSTITPGAITAILNTGSNVTLQANNDITVSSAIAANNASGNGGALTLEAGRSITFDANVGTDNGNLNALAGSANANGSYRDAGTATITVANGVTLNAGSGTMTLSGDALALNGTLSGTGSLQIAPATASRTIGIAGGSGGLTLAASAFSSNIGSGFSSVTIGGANAGDISVGSTALTFNAPLRLLTPGAITLGSGASLASTNRALILNADADSNGGRISINGSTTISTGGGAIVMGGGSCTASGCSAAAQGTGAAGTEGIELLGTSGNLVTLSSGGGLISLWGRGGTGGGAGMLADYVALDSGAAGSVVLRGDGWYTASSGGNGDGLVLANSTFRGGGGGLSFTGNANTNNAGQASSAIAFNNGAAYATNGGALALSASAPQASGGNTYLAGSGTYGHASLQNGNMTVTFSGTSMASPTLPNVVLPSGNLVVNLHRDIVDGNNQVVGGTTTINGGGSGFDVTLGTAGGFNGGTLAVSNARNVSVVDSNTLALGAFASIAGTIDVTTATGNLTVAQSLATSSASATAIALTAGRNSAAGTATGGDILVTGSPTLTTGTGGGATLYTGSVAGSTGVAALVGVGSGRFRYNSTAAAANYTSALAAGVNAVFREQPTITVTAGNAAKTYDGQAFSGGNGIGAAGFVNGDTTALLSGTTFGGTSQGVQNAGSYSIAPTASTGVGYALSFVNGTLTINPAALSAALTGSTVRSYDGTAVATLSPGNFALTGFVAGEGASVTQTVGAYGNANAGAGKGVTVSLSSGDFLAASGTSLSNYVLPTSAAGSIGTIDPAALTVTANPFSRIYDGVAWSGGSGVSYSGFVNGEGSGVLGGTLAYGGDSQGALNAGAYQIVPGGLSSTNYAISYAPGALTIERAPLIATLTGAIGKVYDGTTAATLGSGTAVSLSGFVGSDGATANPTVGSFDSADAGGQKTVTAVLGSGDFAAVGGTNLSNYSLPATASGAIGSISRAPLTVSAVSASKVHDGVAYRGGNGVTFGGFVNGETETVLGGVLTYGGNSQGAVDAGSYVVTPGGLASANYAIDFVDGTLTIGQFPAVLMRFVSPAPVDVTAPANAPSASSSREVAGSGTTAESAGSGEPGNGGSRECQPDESGDGGSEPCVNP